MTAPSPYPRQERDYYATPAWVTHVLLDSWMDPAAARRIYWEPCAGAGHMSAVLEERCGADRVLAQDIDPQPPVLGQRGPIMTADFLKAGPPSDCALRLAIVTNPPYSHPLAAAIVARALDITARCGGAVAMLLPFDWSAAPGRARFFSDCPAFAGKIEITTRIRWANISQKDNGPKNHHAWYIWDWHAGHRARVPALQWARGPARAGTAPEAAA